MKLAQTLAGLVSSSSSQPGKWPLLRTVYALQFTSLATEATAKCAPKKRISSLGDQTRGPEAVPVKPEEEGEAPRLRKPSEIPWQAKIANLVQLIGYVGAPIQLGTSPDGTYTAVSVLHHEKTHNHPPFWIPIVFQGDLAQIAACNLRKNDHVYVTGQLTREEQPIDDNAESKMRVMVHSLSYVLEQQLETKHEKNSGGSDSSSADPKKLGESVESSWSDLVENPQQWWDNREDKLNGKVKPKYPDFSHKLTKKGLWLNSAPGWVLTKLESGVVAEGKSSKPHCQSEAKKSSTTRKAESWKDLMTNPDKWWDNRSSKRKQNAPDFKHKETGEALWLDATVPKWILDKLPPINAENKENTLRI